MAARSPAMRARYAKKGPARCAAEALASLPPAARWGPRDKPLYRAHLALTRLAAGEPVRALQETTDALAQAPCGQGYGRFILGHLAYAAGEWVPARRYLQAFVDRTQASGALMAIALDGELRLARATLAKMSDN